MSVGTADPVVPYHASIDYYERVVARLGSLENARGFVRLYLIPGLAHGGGPGIINPPDLFGAVRAWRQKGTVPDGLVGRRMVAGKTELEMPLYPYPDKTGWDAATSSFQRVAGPRGGVEPIADRFLPPTAE